LSVVTYTVTLSKGDKADLASLFRKAFRREFCRQTFSTDELIIGCR